MDFDTEIATLIQQYRIDKLNWHTTIEEILAEPRYIRVWEHWIALAHFKQQNYFERIEDAPTDQTWITIMDKTRKSYERKNGEWVFIQEISKEECKAIYGD